MNFEQQIQSEDSVNSAQHMLVVPPRGAQEDFGTEDVPYDGAHLKEKLFAIVGAFSVTGLVLVGTVASFVKQPPVETEVAVVEKIQESVPKPPEKVNPFDSIALQAKATIVYDINEDRVLYASNEKKKLPLASLTKLMTALLALESLDPKSNIAISPRALETEGDSGLFANETWKVADLVGFTMVTSSNDGADALATVVGSLWESTPRTVFSSTSDSEYKKVDSFVKKMNDRAKDIGLENTLYMNATGLDVPSGGGLGTADDVSKLLTYIWKNNPEAIRYTNEYQRNFISEDGLAHFAENTNENVYKIPGLLGGKTGYTDLAGGNLAVIYDAGLNHPIVVVVLGSTREGRFSDVKTLVDATYEYTSSGWAEYEKIAGSTVKNNTQY
jgi:D-alanyl-D-alanine carboxypeptidase